MEHEYYLERFSGVGRLYGERQLEMLAQSHFMVVGVGGVGSWSAEALARSGVGHITLIDDDDISASNMNRQLHTLDSTVGRPKVAVLAERLAEINRHLCCQIQQQRMTISNIGEFLPLLTEESRSEKRVDGVIDAVDAIAVKAALIYHCRRNKIAVITSGAAGGVVDPRQITLADLSRTENDPLAAKVRALLRREYGFSSNPKRRFGVECVYSTESCRYPTAEGGVSHARPGVAGLSLDCSLGYGASVAITAIFGMMAAGRLLHRFLERAEVRA
ncbi:MAG: tRNA threonylcarbamoyladenosine dehydratase [Gammaproteobacteria bacterium]|nr:tRNA threonylcarbamoyladenosine dehydratase [Gammaproteobacteria bacterium]